jgi:hypothetical protein
MKPQTPATGISLEYDSDGTKAYRIDCDCSCADHSVSTWIEVSAFDEVGVDVVFYVKTWTPYDLSQGGLWMRIKKAANVLFKGVDTQEHGILLKEQAATNWICAVENSIKDMKSHMDYRD